MYVTRERGGGDPACEVRERESVCKSPVRGSGSFIHCAPPPPPPPPPVPMPMLSAPADDQN